jgi:hypothetical protein
MKEEQPLVFGLNNQILQEKGNYYNLILYIVITAMERMMAKGIALFTVMFMLIGCGAHVNISASAPKGKDLDITVKTTEND